MFRSRKERYEPAHLRDDYVPLHADHHVDKNWQPDEHTSGGYTRVPSRRRGMTTLEALEVIRLRYEAAQQDLQPRHAA